MGAVSQPWDARDFSRLAAMFEAVALIVFQAFFLFAALFVCQLVLAHTVKPRSQDRFVILLYLVVPTVAFLGWCVFQLFRGQGTYPGFLSFLLYFVIATSWVGSFPAVYVEAPTLAIVLILHLHPEGLTREALATFLNLRGNSLERVNDAVTGGIIARQGDVFQLTSLGKILFGFYLNYRKLLGLRLEGV